MKAEERRVIISRLHPSAFIPPEASPGTAFLENARPF
jgi:hypothetical protein